MATYLWRAVSGSAGGAFDSSNSWNEVTTGANPAPNPPGTNDTAILNTGGGPLTGTGSVAALTFSAANWSIAGQIAGNTVAIDASTVSVTTNGGELIANSALNLGLAAAASLGVANGGVVEVTAASSAPASQVGNAGIVVAAGGLASFGALSLGVNGTTTATIDASVLAIGGALLIGASGSATLVVQDGAEAVLSAAGDATKPYLQLGAAANTYGAVQVTGTNSILAVASNAGSVGDAGAGSLAISGGGSARFGSSNNALDPALTIGLQRTGSGGVSVSGTGSTLAVTGSIIVGEAGTGALSVLNGATATSIGLTSAQAALAVAAGLGSGGTLVIDGAGSQLSASGVAIIGGDNRGSGLSAGGVGSVAITNGGTLLSNGMIIEAGSIVAIDGASQEGIYGDLTTLGILSNFGSLTVTGTLSGGGALRAGAGYTQLGNVNSANIAFVASSATVRIDLITGNSNVSGMQYGDAVDLVGNTAVRLTGDTVTTVNGTLTLSAPPAGAAYALASDGNGGTFVSLDPETIGVYRFFDSNYGTHFFTASATEEATILATRPDLVYEGVGLESIDPSSNDPNAVPVFRFFDSTYGTHFFTASASERDTVLSSRPDLIYEGVGFYEDTTQQPGDIPVYRFFDTHYGTHFYSGDANEVATIIATRPDLVNEGIGFYAPS